MTEQLLLQQLESPSGTGRVEPRSQISLPAPALNERDATSRHSFSLAVLRESGDTRECCCATHRRDLSPERA